MYRMYEDEAILLFKMGNHINKECDFGGGTVVFCSLVE